MNELDIMAVKAKEDEDILNKFIEENEYLILKWTSTLTRRYISKSDDEWSIAINAFNSAIQAYCYEKGSFLSFAKLVIHNKLVDYFRSQSKYSAELSVQPSIFDSEPEENDEDLSLKIAVAKKTVQIEENPIVLEIKSVNQILKSYGFSFIDLADCSPKAKKTKTSCALAINYILNTPLLLNSLQSTKLLPISLIEKNMKVPRKLLERHRKYIIAAAEILSGEYPCLAEYMQYIRKESDK